MQQKSAEPLNISDTTFAFANDIVRVFSFGSDNNLLEDLKEAKFQRESLWQLLQGVALNKQFPWIQRSLATIVTTLLGSKGLPPTVLNMLEWRSQAGKDIEAVFADKSEKSRNTPSIFYGLRDSTILPPHEKSVKRLQDEATLLLMAGTESPAKSMTIASFYIVSQPEIMSKLREELFRERQKASPDTLSLGQLTSLPYMNAVYTEANRLSFGVTRRTIRYSPNEVLTYTARAGPYRGKTYKLPPGTRMSSITLCIHTDEELFPDPWKFDPERWLTKAESEHGGVVEEVNRRKKAMMGLGKGHRVCLGKNVAHAEICLMLQVLADYDLKLYETDESDVKFQHDYQISHPRLDSKGVRMVVDERHSE